MLSNDGDEIAETCRRYINCTVMYTVCANLSCVNKIKKIHVAARYAGV